MTFPPLHDHKDIGQRLRTDLPMDLHEFRNLSRKLHQMTSGDEIGLRNLHNWAAIYKDYDAGAVNTRWNQLTNAIEDPAPEQAENSGGNVSYYLCSVINPNQAAEPYVAECSDIMEALNMDFPESNAFRAIWRKAAERTIGKKKAGNEARRDAEKVVWSGKRMLATITGKKV